MKNYLQILLFVTFISVTFTNCSKDKIRGCTDPTASNYNSKAEENDGSCVYPPKTYTVEYKFGKVGSGTFIVYYIKNGTTYTETNPPDGWTTSFTGTAGDYLSMKCTPPSSGTGTQQELNLTQLAV